MRDYKSMENIQKIKGEVRESADLKFRAQAIAPELDRDNNLRSRMEQIVACRRRVVLLDLLGRSMNNFTTLPFTRKVILTRSWVKYYFFEILIEIRVKY